MNQTPERPVRFGGRTLRRAVVAAAAGAIVLVPAASTSAAPIVTQVAVKLTTTISHPYQPVTATATVTPSTAAGTVTFARSGTTLCSAAAVGGGTAHCTFTPTATSAAAAVTATYTPTEPTLSAAGSAASPTLTVGKYAVIVKGTYSDNGSATCGKRALTITVTRAVVSGAAPTAALPAPTGTVSVGGAVQVALQAGGTGAACTAVTSGGPVVDYSGDARYLGGEATATKLQGVKLPAHTRTGSTPNVGTGGLANTASTRVAPLLIIALALLLTGLGCSFAGRRRTPVA